MSGRGRTLILIGVVLFLGAILVGVFLLRGSGGGGAAPTPEPQVAQIVVAVQSIPRGSEIVSGTVALRAWPVEQLPPGFLVDVAEAEGRFARFDIPPGLPILPEMMAETSRLALAEPSELPKQIPPGKVAVALPVTRLSSVAYALKAGDHVDVLATLFILDLDEEFQTQLYNDYMLAIPSTKEGTITFLEINPGGRDRNPVFGFPALDRPSEAQRPRIVAQLTVQNMVVLGVGDWLSQSQPAVEAPPESAEGPPTPAPQAAAAVPELDIITVVVDPQDALVLNFLRESGAVIDLALRSSEDGEQTFTTESVTLQYMFTRFEIAEPPRLTYGIEPKFVPTPAPAQ